MLTLLFEITMKHLNWAAIIVIMFRKLHDRLLNCRAKNTKSLTMYGFSRDKLSASRKSPSIASYIPSFSEKKNTSMLVSLSKSQVFIYNVSLHKNLGFEIVYVLNWEPKAYMCKVVIFIGNRIDLVKWYNLCNHSKIHSHFKLANK